MCNRNGEEAESEERLVTLKERGGRRGRSERKGYNRMNNPSLHSSYTLTRKRREGRDHADRRDAFFLPSPVIVMSRCRSPTRPRFYPIFTRLDASRFFVVIFDETILSNLFIQQQIQQKF